MTTRLYLDDAMLREATATVTHSGPDGVVLDRSPLYARSGGQPGDAGILTWSGGRMSVNEARKGEGDDIVHVPPQDAALPEVGTPVQAIVEWPRRLAHMRMHTAMHLLCAVLPGAAVTGGQIGTEKSRLDFDLAEAPDKTALEAKLSALVDANHDVTAEWVDDSVLDANPGLVRTLSVQPPRGAGRIRLVRIGTGELQVDLQPCGGTHVTSTGQIGRIRILKVENKGRQNRRISIGLEP